MPSNKPWLEGPSTRDRAMSKIWQGAMVFVIGASVTAVTHFGFGFVWIITVVAAVAGFFWLLVGLVTFFTGYE